ncbi:valine--tRNA ligase-like isoform X2 [Scylla paramamosain]|uniref:valine--tRNA ligase-like isoform X2 n=1 Tax=Scylla paramamosain TaxID=85552 RepID=UPI003083E4A1
MGGRTVIASVLAAMLGVLMMGVLSPNATASIFPAVNTAASSKGAVKVTPGHSHEDCQVRERYSIPFLSILDSSGKGLLRFEARGAVPSALSALGLYRGCHAHPMTVPRCSRTQDVIEPVLRPQWFAWCKELAQEASEAVQSGRLTLVPQLHRRAWHSWLDNITDWCVSQQLWWGHKIPVYHITAADGWEVWVAAAWRRMQGGRLWRRKAHPWPPCPPSRRKMFWTPGSPLACFPLPRWAGRVRGGERPCLTLLASTQRPW